jgi:opacity protein-like surface antigen
LGDSLLGDKFELPDKAIPPIRASVDYALFAPFTVGAEAGFFVYKDEASTPGLKVTSSGTGLAFAGRFGYHPDFSVKNLDVYATAGLGLYILSWKNEGKYSEEVPGVTSSSWSIDDSDSEFAFILTVGARYFFTKNIGVFANVGLGPLSVLTGGVALKF